MRLIERMADKIRHSVRSFLRIEPAQSNVIQIQETMDFHRIQYGIVEMQMSCLNFTNRL